MENQIQKKVQESKSIFNKIKGGHSFASIDSDFYENISLNDLFSAIDTHQATPMFVSGISWIEFYEMYNENDGTRCELGLSSLIHEIRENFQRVWSFNKMYNSTEVEKFAHLEMQINLAVDEIEASLLEIIEFYEKSEIFHFDAGGYDYSVIAIEFIRGVQIIEFLWYID